MQCVMPTGPSCAGRPAPTAGSPDRTAHGRHILGDRTGDSDPRVCPVWIVSRTPMPLPHISVLVATERGRPRCAACRATRRGEATRVGSPGRVPRRSNRSAPSARPAVTSSTRGSRTLHSRSRLRRVHVPGLLGLSTARVPWPRPAGEFIDNHRAPPRAAQRTAPGAAAVNTDER
jgi:hypothetical protein